MIGQREAAKNLRIVPDSKLPVAGSVISTSHSHQHVIKALGLQHAQEVPEEAQQEVEGATGSAH